MEKIHFSFETGNTIVAPKEGNVLMVRFRHMDRNESDTVFCDYAIGGPNGVNLFGCRSKTFLVSEDGNLSRDYAIVVGGMTLSADQMVEFFELATPSWYHCSEPDARLAADKAGKLAMDVGTDAVLSAMVG